MRKARKYVVMTLGLLCLVTLLVTKESEQAWYRGMNPETAERMRGVRENYLTSKPEMKLCPEVSPLLYREYTPVNLTVPTWDEVARSVHNVGPGGVHAPSHCRARQSIVIVVPMRNREEHLRTLLRHMHPFLQRQQAHYAILVVEETKTPLFNKGITINIGFLEAVKLFNPDCVIIHDVDQLPEDDRNTYRCDENLAVHLAVQLSQLGHRLTYADFFGAGIALTPKQFMAGNGFSTEFYGWGQEDDDMLHRVLAAGLNYTRRSDNITFYASMTHERDKEFVENPGNQALHDSRVIEETNFDFMKEGLNTTNYRVAETIIHPLYVHVKAEAATPLVNYKHASDAIPCAEDFTFRSNDTLVTCARECNAQTHYCPGFVYNFNETADYRCYLKGRICGQEESIEDWRFFLKEEL